MVFHYQGNGLQKENKDQGSIKKLIIDPYYYKIIFPSPPLKTRTLGSTLAQAVTSSFIKKRTLIYYFLCLGEQSFRNTLPSIQYFYCTENWEGRSHQLLPFLFLQLAFLLNYSNMKGPKITSRSTVRSTLAKDPLSFRWQVGEAEELQVTKPNYTKQTTDSKFCNINIVNACESTIWNNPLVSSFEVNLREIYNFLEEKVKNKK